MRILLADDAALLREGLAGLLAAAGHEVVAQVGDADALRSEVERLAALGDLPDVVVTDVRMPPTGTDDGLRAAVDLRRAHPGLPVVVLSAYVAGQYVQELLEETEGAKEGAPSGAVGYLLKERVGRVADFLRSLDVVVAGGVVIDPEVVAHLMRAARGTGLDGGKCAVEVAGDSSGRDSSGRGSGGAGGNAALGSGTGPDTTGAGGSDAAGARGARSGTGSAGLSRLTPREQEVLELMAQGLSNTQIGERLVLSDGAVAKHVANVFLKLDLPPGEDNRRVRAVLTWLRATT